MKQMYILICIVISCKTVRKEESSTSSIGALGRSTKSLVEQFDRLDKVVQQALESVKRGDFREADKIIVNRRKGSEALLSYMGAEHADNFARLEELLRLGQWSVKDSSHKIGDITEASNMLGKTMTQNLALINSLSIDVDVARRAQVYSIINKHSTTNKQSITNFGYAMKNWMESFGIIDHNKYSGIAA